MTKTILQRTCAQAAARSAPHPRPGMQQKTATAGPRATPPGAPRAAARPARPPQPQPPATAWPTQTPPPPPTRLATSPAPAVPGCAKDMTPVTGKTRIELLESKERTVRTHGQHLHDRRSAVIDTHPFGHMLCPGRDRLQASTGWGDEVVNRVSQQGGEGGYPHHVLRHSMHRRSTCLPEVSLRSGPSNRAAAHKLATCCSSAGCSSCQTSHVPLWVRVQFSKSAHTGEARLSALRHSSSATSRKKGCSMPRDTHRYARQSSPSPLQRVTRAGMMRETGPHSANSRSHCAS